MPIEVPIPGVPNLYQVTPSLYRSAQPKRKGFAKLAELGLVKTVLNLRLFNEDPENIGLRRRWVRCEAGLMSRMKMAACLDIITHSRNWPILVHCLHGADRTGVVIAAYRISIEGWTADDAIEEMVNGPYGFHRSFYPNLIRVVQDWAYNIGSEGDA